MTIESIVEKWATCRYSLVVGFGGEDGYALKEDGYNESYCCEHPEVVESSASRKMFSEDGEQKTVALIYGLGKFDAPQVLEALERRCGKCLLFKYLKRH